MSASLPNGTIYSIASAYGDAIPFTALTNAAPPVAAAVAHGLSDGDVLEVSSGWLALNDRPARVTGKTADAFSLEGYDCTSVAQFPAGTGAGSVRKVTAWTQISQVMGSETSGGEQQFVEWSYLEDNIQRRKPTTKSAKTLTLTLADDESLAWNAVMEAADQAGTGHIVRAALPSGGFIYYNMYVGFDGEPKMSKDNIMTVTATFNQVGKFKRYAA